ncbi:phosphatase PAP2 family protein [Actinoplanes sp. NPDC051470]|uniref:phosphatase PAP2 family protein n=1 Tax=Actinoplanes sp. NPDC051470 TaxID=3157224 RepID=UPI00341E70CB
MTRPRSWWPDLVFVGAFALLTVLLAQGHLLGADAVVADWSDAHRPPVAYWIARVLNSLGQGGWLLMPLAVLLAVLLAWRTRSVRPLLVFLATGVLTYLTIGPAKIFFQRAAPAFTGPDRTILFNDAAVGPLGMSYPSGHVANAVVWYAVIAFLLAGLIGGLGRRARLALRILPPVIVFGTTTYLSWHWITDSIAGLFLGLVLARLLARVPWETLPLPRWLERRAPVGASRPGS